MPATRARAGESLVRLLVIIHFVVSGVSLLGSLCSFVLYRAGTSMLDVDTGDRDFDYVTRMQGRLLMAASLVFFFVGFLQAAWLGQAALWSWSRRSRVASVVVSSISLVFFPMGTVLGALTILVLLREDVKAQFGAAAA